MKDVEAILEVEGTYTPTDVTLSDPVPIEDELELRDALASDYRANMERMGTDTSNVPFEVWQQIAAADLLLVENADIPEPKAKAPKPEQPKVETRANDRSLMELQRRAVPQGPEQNFSPNVEGLLTPDRKMKLVARLMRICQPIEGMPGDIVNCTHMAYPKWGREIVRETVNAEQGLRQYHGRSIEDRKRMLLRAFEDIADRSRVDLGPWWVK